MSDVALAARLAALMQGYQNANRSSAEALIDSVSPLLYRYLLHQTKNPDDAADLLQETWLRIHKVRHTFRPGEPLLPWVFAIARHVKVDSYRKKTRIAAREITLPDGIEASAPPPSDMPGFEEMIAGLPPSQQEVLMLLKVSGMSLEEVARATASTVGSVKQKAHRAYEKLRQVLR